jgi:hypothetical protein
MRYTKISSTIVSLFKRCLLQQSIGKLFLSSIGLLLSINVHSQLWGTLQYGGSFDNGTIYKYVPETHAFNIIVHFNGADGKNPRSHLTYFNGKPYGVTFEGGNSGAGVLFEIDPETNQFTKKVDFSGQKFWHPLGGLGELQGSFYGLCPSGGSFLKGVIYKWDPITNILSKEADFNGANNGANSVGTMIAFNKKLYGATYGGGLFYRNKDAIYPYLGLKKMDYS